MARRADFSARYHSPAVLAFDLKNTPKKSFGSLLLGELTKICNMLIGVEAAAALSVVLK